MRRIAPFFLAVLFAGAAQADDQSSNSAFSGHLDAYLGGILLNAPPANDLVGFQAGGTARLNVAFAERANVQGDLFVNHTSSTDGDIASYGGVAHLYWRNPSAFAIGGFGQITRFNVYPDAETYRYGGEAQYYLSKATLYGQVWAGKTLDTSIPYSFNLVGVRGVVRYYPMDNIRLEGEVAFERASGGGVSIDGVTLAAQANYRFSDSPLGLYARYQYDHYTSNIPPPDAGIHHFVAGVRLAFGAPTLQAEDTGGATMTAYRNTWDMLFGAR